MSTTHPSDLEPCPVRWTGTTAPEEGSHWCMSIGPHPAHRCCCGETTTTQSAAPPSVRDLAAQAVHRVDCGCDAPNEHTPEVWPEYYALADAVLAVINKENK